MKKLLLFLGFAMTMCGCEPHHNFNKDGGIRIKMQADIGSMLKDYIPADDSIAFFVLDKTNKEYANQNETFLEVYFKELSLADPSTPPGKHFKADGLSPTASLKACENFFQTRLEESMSGIIAIIENRFHSFEMPDASIRQGNTPETVLLEFPGSKSVERIREILKNSPRIEFWETYDNVEIFPLLNDLNKTLAKEQSDGLEDTVAEKKTKPVNNGGSLKDQLAEQESEKREQENKSSNERKELIRVNPLFTIYAPAIKSTDSGSKELASGAVIGYSDYKDTAKMNKCLSRLASTRFAGGYMKFLWGFKPIDKEGNFYSLFAIKMNRERKAPLSGNFIVSASRITGDNGVPQISVKMDKESGFKWREITRNNIGRSIALVVDNEVYSYPVVQAEISGGISTITGNFSISEVDDLVNILNAGYFPVRVNIVQEDIVPPIGAK